MDSSYQLYIDGKWVDGREGKTFETHCPANGEVLATCVEAGKEDVDLAVKAAWRAFDSWKKLGAQERAAILLKVADRVDENAEHFALVESMNVGKPIRECRWDVELFSDQFR
jgi:acyl-CoA reductase-like NAD-dependent aldehyde dehydrogenase